MKRLPIGVSSFKKIIDDDYYYVDKTLFIDDIVKYGSGVTLLPRPRRFGKTLNMSMLKYFFEKSSFDHAYLFKDKKVWQIPEIQALQGKFPVIFLTFKDIKQSMWEVTREKLIAAIVAEYIRHDYLLESNDLNKYEKTIFKRVCIGAASDAEYHNSLKNLSEYLHRFHKIRPFVLLDEYDSPIHAGFLHGYYQQITEFMRGLLTAVFKDNDHLEKGVITGILRTAKEGIFSGLNNLEVFTVLDDVMADKFGFTEQEVQQLLHDYHLEEISQDFRSWYNGYLIGKTNVYNPWSALSCVKAQGVFLPYWVNTSDNALVAALIAQASPQIKDECAQLLKGETLEEIRINDKMVLPGMNNDPHAVWTLLLLSGYLTVATYRLEEGIRYVGLTLPNKELLVLFKTLIDDLFKQSLGYSEVAALETALKEADEKLFAKLLSKFILQSASFHDIPADEPEKSYHLFVLGLLVVLSHRYAVRSNRESGYGRYDIMLIPHDKLLPGLVIEFKKKDDDETMDECAYRALEQIEKKNYAVELRSQGIENITLWGIACYKKEMLLKVG